MMKSSAWRAWLAVLFLCCLFGTVVGCFLLPNLPPVASFVVVYNVTEDPMVVDLDASTSSDPDGDAIASYSWTFGDDVDILTPLTESKKVYVPVIRVRYPDSYVYTIQLLVTDDDEDPRQSELIEQTITLPHI
ncbi:MAG: PKD domain-containing protein [Candidatus Bipolaricaulota bacterium]